MSPLLTKFGTQYGNRLLRTGRQFFVAPDTSAGAATPYTGIAGQTVSASNNNDGLSPERPVATVDYAVNTLATQVGDMVILLPGVHTVLNQVVPKAGVAIFGSQMAESTGWGMSLIGGEVSGPTVLTSVGTNIHLLNIKNNNVEVGWLTLRPTAGFSAVIFAPETGGAAGPASFATTSSASITGIFLHDLVLDLKTVATLGTGNLQTRGIDFGCRFNTGTGHLGRLGARFQATVFAQISNCTFYGSGGQGEALHLATCQVHVIHPIFRLESNTAAGLAANWASAMVVASSVANSLVEEGIWLATGTAAYGSCIDGGSANAYNIDAITVVNSVFPRSGQLTYTTNYTQFGASASGGVTGLIGTPAHGFPTNGIVFVNSFVQNASGSIPVTYSGGA